MNGNGSRVNTYNIFLNSKNRDDNYYNIITSGTMNYLAWCSWNLRKVIVRNNPFTYFTISVKNMILPFTFDTIGSLNKTFNIVYNGITYNIACNEGTPNITQLLTDIKAKIVAVIPSLSTTLSFTYNSSDLTITITNTSSYDITFAFNNNFIGKMLGFTTDINVLNTTGIETSNININVNPLECVFVRSDNLTFISSYESIVDKSNISDIIALIPIQVSSGNYIVYNDTGAFETRLGDDRIDRISIYLTSAIDDDHLLNLNRDWTIHIQINEYSYENTLAKNIDFNKVEQTENKDELQDEKKYLDMKERDLENKLEEMILKKTLKNKKNN